MSISRNYKKSGFTLIELMIAVAIFSLMTVFAYAGVNQIINTRVLAAQSLDRLASVQFALRQMALDIEQIHPRPVREEFGDSLVPTVIADLRRFNQLEMTRAGWRNPLGTPRPTLQRVAYRLEDGELIRSHWNVLDRMQMNPPVEFTLLSDIDSFELQFMNEAGEWVSSWPDPDLPGQLQLGARPRAVEIIIRFEDAERGELRRVIEVLR
ncbi:MAG: type II secretion system minor pseudopilin GspJ [Gammaproteobacteria bacterium]|nr:type II secretion system minor pseudopilin GspJ [Gammaproteobacteria bacterium]